MNKKLNSENQSQPFPFVPRSVLMALESQSTKTKEKKSAKKGGNSVGGSRGVLLKSIADFLESSGFQKTLDVFISEAKIQENSWKPSAVNLDDIFSRFFDSSNGKEAVSIQCEEPQGNEKETEKKKRKSNNGNTDDSETLNVEKSTPVEGAKKERKEKKKNKSNVDKSTPVEEETEEPKEEIKEAKNKKKMSKKENGQLENKVEELQSSNDENKAGKKRKKKKEVKELNEIGDKGKENKEKNHENVKQKSTVGQQNGENGERKVSKKRKKPDSEENDYEGKGNKEEENSGNDTNAPVIENGNKEPKSGKKDKSLDEPKSANAFKRVKIEEVKFADQRLQDNSYWAKGGADSGYGAKAQQILEQVRGRDFRHEKTKKKRGSYRGGQIDLQSHSIKFNYSDEE